MMRRRGTFSRRASQQPVTSSYRIHVTKRDVGRKSRSFLMG
jgi:hypothetical protein